MASRNWFSASKFSIAPAVSADPAYALPYVALANLYMYDDILGNHSTDELVPKAKEALHRALALDDELAEAATRVSAAAVQPAWGRSR